MQMIGMNTSEVEQKNKKMMKIILILAVIIVIICCAIIGALYYIQNSKFRFIVDQKEITSYSQDLFLFNEDNKVYISIKDMAKLVGYTAYNGSYGSQFQYSEDNTKCYVEGKNEISSFELDSNKLYKMDIATNDYQYFDIDEPVIQVNNKLYTTEEGISKAYNLSFSYNKSKNNITIFTLPYLVNYYSKNIKNSEIKEDFSVQKALLYNYVIVSTGTSETKKYGINSLNGKEVVGTKYSKIEFIESTKEFLVTTSEGKKGIITATGETKVQPKYDELKQIDKNLNLYLATLNNKKGIIENNGKILIYLEYDEIGINSDTFPTNNIKNPYLLYGNCIPVSKNKKWGMYDKTGKLIVPLEYDGLGCIVKDSNKSYNNILLIPEIKCFVAYKKEENTTKYTILNSLGKTVIQGVLDSVYSEITSGREDYYMIYADTKYNVIDFINENIDLDELNKQ